jgi:hypothetical protein
MAEQVTAVRTGCRREDGDKAASSERGEATVPTNQNKKLYGHDVM